jgi:hypothetical protein
VNEDPAASESRCYSFRLTAEDAETAASRVGLRQALIGRLSLNHVAPLVAFALMIVFVAILTFTGLIARRLGEAALIVAVIIFMAARMITHWRLRAARKTSMAATEALQKNGPIVIRLEDSRIQMETSMGSTQLAFNDCEEAEEAGGIIYLWARKGAPVFIPAHAFPSEPAAREFLSRVRQGIKSAAKR